MTPPSLWRLRNFRPMCASTTATNLGDGVMAVPVPWLATLLTHDPLLIGLVAGARTLPRRVPPPNPATLMISLREGLG